MDPVKTKPTFGIDEKDVDKLSTNDSTQGIVAETIYVDPEKERAVLRKFDKYVLPQAFLFILLNFLDR
jgi:hypothetical protein